MQRQGSLTFFLIFCAAGVALGLGALVPSNGRVREKRSLQTEILDRYDLLQLPSIQVRLFGPANLPTYLEC
jgi:hypothetical protein